MNKIICILLLSSLIFSKEIFSQEKKKWGRVVNKENNNVFLSGASVYLIKEGRIVAQKVSNSNGLFEFYLTDVLKSDSLRIAKKDFQIFTCPLEDIKFNSQDYIGNFALISNVITLKEVVLKANGRYSDTIRIDFKSEKYDDNIMIDNVLSGHKGFSKGANGLLYFNGKLVSDVSLNNGVFFGVNNLNIYRYLPALTLDNIEVIETNIDTLTNTVMLNPVVKVNLKMKSQYKKGKFGSINTGYGTAQRYLFASDLYQYFDDHQISLILNSNNINSGDDPYNQPNVHFSYATNNVISNSGVLNYRSLYVKKKLELNTSLKVHTSSNDFSSDVESFDSNTDQSVKIHTLYNTKLYGLEYFKLNAEYKYNDLNLIKTTQSISYSLTNQSDSTRYDIIERDLVLDSRLGKSRDVFLLSILNDFSFLRKFKKKKGRSLTINFNSNASKYNTDEITKEYSSVESRGKLFDSDRLLKQNIWGINGEFTEPLTYNSYIQLFSKIYKNAIDFSEDISINLDNSYSNNFMDNYFFQSGIKFQKSFRKISTDIMIKSISNTRIIEKNREINKNTLHNLDANLNFDYKIDKRKKMLIRIQRNTQFPEINQLTNIDNSIDLIVQRNSNFELKPEIKNRLDLNYEFRKSDSLTFSFQSNLELYEDKFGYNIDNSQGLYQRTFIDNVGNAKSFEVALLVLKSIKNAGLLNYRIMLNYKEIPSVLNNQKTLNKGVNFIQSVSTNFSLLKNIISVRPTLYSTYTKYSYGITKGSMLNATYSDKISIKLPKIITLNFYPIINHSRNISNTTSWALNVDLEREFAKGNGRIWLKGYDLFNSFTYTNNFMDLTSSRSLKYSNLNRYLLLGVSFKFNNMKKAM